MNSARDFIAVYVVLPIALGLWLAWVLIRKRDRW